ncbi:hypothetical protein BvCms2925_01759 [Escherichia coli]|nr:hypothetical protein BvCms2925_01759 [Escherichia coli]
MNYVRSSHAADLVTLISARSVPGAEDDDHND